jgi:predicted acetyltransferase
VTVRVRTLADDEVAAAISVDWRAFGSHPSEAVVAAEGPGYEPGRSLAATDGDAIVATARAWSSELALPGSTSAPAAAVTGVGVLATHRRRGILRALMDRQLADVRERGEPLAVLVASEGGIYGRFGYGPATVAAELTLSREGGAPADPTPAPGPFRLLDAAAAARELPPLHERLRRARPGEIRRSDGWWHMFLADPDDHRGGASARFYAVYEPEPGRAAGYAAYRIHDRWEGGIPAMELRVSDLCATDISARLALWRFLLGVDLIETLTIYQAPVDEPLRVDLADPRQLRLTALVDHLWVRLVDLPAALAARRYAVEGRVVLEVADPVLPDNAGTFELVGGPDGATCRRGGGAPDLAVDVADLGAVYLGGARLSTLARAGKVAELRPGALRRADAMLAADPPPFCGTGF